jgi:hypothetical protein
MHLRPLFPPIVRQVERGSIVKRLIFVLIVTTGQAHPAHHKELVTAARRS